MPYNHTRIFPYCHFNHGSSKVKIFFTTVLRLLLYLEVKLTIMNDEKIIICGKLK